MVTSAGLSMMTKTGGNMRAERLTMTFWQREFSTTGVNGDPVDGDGVDNGGDEDGHAGAGDEAHAAGGGAWV